jgi:hypothetical protein
MVGLGTASYIGAEFDNFEVEPATREPKAGLEGVIN